MAASAGKADPLVTRIKLSQRECLLSPKAAVRIGRKSVKLGTAFGSEADKENPATRAGFLFFLSVVVLGGSNLWCYFFRSSTKYLGSVNIPGAKRYTIIPVPSRPAYFPVEDSPSV